ncbi:MAG: glutamine amidotransferase [Planctomycetota bacterium]
MPTALYFPYIPPFSYLIPGALLIVALIALLYVWSRPMIDSRPRNFLMAVRLVVILLILFCICHPLIRIFKSEKLESLVAVVMDDSLSMSIEDEVGGLKRTEKMQRSVFGPEHNLTDTLGEHFRVRTYRFAGDLEDLPERKLLETKGDRTNIAKSLSSLLARLSQETVSAVLLLSDGADNGRENISLAVKAFRENGMPIYTVALGGQKAIRDIAIADVSIHREVMLDTIVTLAVKVQSSGFDGSKVPVLLKRGPQEIARAELALKGGAQEVEIEFTPKEVGLLEFSLAIPPQKDEFNEENNRETFIVNSEKHKIKVLYMEGTQYRQGAPGAPTGDAYTHFTTQGLPARDKWEYQYLVQALEEDATVEATTLFRDDVESARKVGIQCVREGFPKTKKDLYKYDVIISSDIDIEYFTKEQLQNTVDFVAEHGGGFVMIGGYTAFGAGGYDESLIDKMLPVDMQGRTDRYAEDYRHPFQWKITEEGQAHPIMQIDPDSKKNEMIWKQMPPFNGFNHVLRAKPAATVLAVHPTQKTVYGPCVMLAVQQYGRGRSIAFCTDTTAGWGVYFEEMWGEGEDNEYFRKFWQNALRWVAAYQYKVPNNPILVSSDRAKYALGDKAEIAVQVVDDQYRPASDAQVSATIQLPSEEKIKKPLERDVNRPGRYVLNFPVEQAGRYTVTASAKLHGEEVGQDVVKFSCKQVDLEKRDYEINRDLLAYIAEQTGGKCIRPEEMGKVIGELKESTHEEQSYVEKSFWDNRYFYTLILGLLCVEWFFRRRQGLP